LTIYLKNFKKFDVCLDFFKKKKIITKYIFLKQFFILVLFPIIKIGLYKTL